MGKFAITYTDNILIYYSPQSRPGKSFFGDKMSSPYHDQVFAAFSRLCPFLLMFNLKIIAEKGNKTLQLSQLPKLAIERLR